MAEESPKERYERLQHQIQSEILRAYPNPTRTGCPGDAAVEAVAKRKDVETDELWEHITHCSPCYAEFLALKQTARARSKRRALLISQLAAAACLILAVAAYALLNRGESDQIHYAEFDLRHNLSFRGANPEKGTEQLNPPLTLESGRVHLKIDLPETWLPGKYDVAFLDRDGVNRVFTASGQAVAEGHTAVLTIDARLNVKPGDYVISLKREDSGWRGFPVRVTGSYFHLW